MAAAGASIGRGRWRFGNTVLVQQFAQLSRTFGWHGHGAFCVDKLFFIVITQAQLFGSFDHSDEAGDHFAVGRAGVRHCHFILLEFGLGGAIDFITY